MKLSVVIATKHRPNELEATVDSLLSQTRPAEELIVIDQGADSTSQRAVEQALLRASLASRQIPQLQYRLDSRLRGAASARNVGIEMARGDIIIFVDDDVVLEPQFLQELLTVYERDSTVAGVSGIITNYARPSLWRRLALRLFWRGPFHDERQPIYWRATGLRDGIPIRVRKFGTTGMSLRRAALGAIRFDDRLPGAWPGEDVDLCCRLGERAKLLIAPEARFVHKRTPTNRASDHWIRRDVQAMHYLYWRNWDRGLKNRLCFVWLNLGYAVLATLGSLRRRSFEPWTMFLEARSEASAYRERTHA